MTQKIEKSGEGFDKTFLYKRLKKTIILNRNKQLTGQNFLKRNTKFSNRESTLVPSMFYHFRREWAKRVTSNRIELLPIRNSVKIINVHCVAMQLDKWHSTWAVFPSCAPVSLWNFFHLDSRIAKASRRLNCVLQLHNVFIRTNISAQH